eukprot:5570900-Pyramimonas_sp.AAC.1
MPRFALCPANVGFSLLLGGPQYSQRSCAKRSNPHESRYSALNYLEYTYSSTQCRCCSAPLAPRDSAPEVAP